MAENMTPAETVIREALAAGPTPGPWHDADDRLRAACTPDALAELLAELDDLRKGWRAGWDAVLMLETEHKQALAELDRLRTENEALRQLLAVRVAGALLYGDDGELQDNTQHPCIDFRRDSPEEIRRKLHERGLANYRRSVEDAAIDAAKGD